MKVKVLGCNGGQSPKVFTSCYLIEDHILIDAGAVCLNLDLEEQRKIDYALITHTHLDHIKDLAFLADNLCGARQNPLTIYGSKETILGLKTHIFNDIIWPDFTVIPSPEQPILKLEVIPTDGSVIDISGFQIKAIPVNHIPGSVGYVVTRDEKTIVFTGDTARTEQIWKQAQQAKDLKAIFTEISFPSSMKELADLSQHFCPQTFQQELKKLAGIEAPIYVSHFKPGLEGPLKREIKDRNLAKLGVHILKQGSNFKF